MPIIDYPPVTFLYRAPVPRADVVGYPVPDVPGTQRVPERAVPSGTGQHREPANTGYSTQQRYARPLLGVGGRRFKSGRPDHLPEGRTTPAPDDGAGVAGPKGAAG
jgi:hypothetical protein